MKLPRLALVLSLLLPMGACTKSDAEADASAKAEQGGVETIVVAPREAPKVTVDEVGDEPLLLSAFAPVFLPLSSFLSSFLPMGRAV